MCDIRLFALKEREYVRSCPLEDASSLRPMSDAPAAASFGALFPALPLPIISWSPFKTYNSFRTGPFLLLNKGKVRTRDGPHRRVRAAFIKLLRRPCSCPDFLPIFLLGRVTHEREKRSEHPSKNSKSLLRPTH